MPEKSAQNIIWTSKRNVVVDLDICRPISLIACCSGMSYPVPQWFLNIPKPARIAWKYFFKAIEWTEVLMVLSLIMLFYREAGHDIGVAIECPGSLACLLYSFYKGNLLFRKQKQLDALVTKVHEVAEMLKSNPVDNHAYYETHLKHYAYYRKYSLGKFYFMVGSVTFMIGDQAVRGFFHPSPTRKLPMQGYFPIDHNDQFQFVLACLAQYLWYMIVGLRDVFGDTTILLIVASVNVQMVYLETLMKDIMARATDQNVKPLLGWWVKAHQQVLSLMEDAKIFTGPLIFTAYLSASILSFFLMIRITEDPNFKIVHSLSIGTIVTMNMIHLYTFSYLGDNLADNSQNLSWAMLDSNLWKLSKDARRSTIIVLTRCTRPLLVMFGDNRVLSATSCGDILTGLFGYFNTLYQLRHT